MSSVDNQHDQQQGHATNQGASTPHSQHGGVTEQQATTKIQSHQIQNPLYTYSNQQYVQQQPLIQSQLIAQPVQYLQQPVQYVTQQQVSQPVQYVSQVQQSQGALYQSQAVAQGAVTSSIQREVVKGESRIEYVPYEKTVIEYEAVQRTDYIPKEKKVTDYYAVQYQTEYIPQVYQDRYIEYIPQERVQERVEYQAVQKQIVHQPTQQVQQSFVQQPVITQLHSSTVQVPVQQQQTVQQVQYVPTASYVQTIPSQAQYVQTVPTAQFVSSGAQFVSSGATTSYVTSNHLSAPLARQQLTSSGVRTLGPVSYSIVEEAIKKNQQKSDE